MAGTAAPSVDWLDSGSLLTAAMHLGVAHPPGEPGWLAPARLAMLLPVGDLAFRVNLLSAAALAGCAFPLMAMVRGIGGSVGLGTWFAALLPLLGYGARMQGNRAEVYALVALLLVGALWAVVVLTGARAAAMFGLLLGLAATIHPLLAAAATPALLAARGVRSLRQVGLAAGAGLWGFAGYAWLPLRARARPEEAWGIPSDLPRFLDVLLGRSFAQNFGVDPGSLPHNALVVLERHGLSGALAVVGLAGVVLLLSRRDAAPPARSARRGLLIAAPLWLVGNALTILPQNKVFGTNPDVLGYLLVGTLAFAPLGGLAVSWLREGAAGSPLQRLAPLLLAVAGIVFALVAWDGRLAARHENTLARRFATAQADALPPGAVLLTSGNDTAFVWRWLQGAERRRPDLVVLHRVLLGHEHERRRLQEDLDRLGLRWTPDLRDRPLDQLASITAPVFIEVREAEQAERGGTLAAHGLVWAVRGGEEAPFLADRRRVMLEALEGPTAAGDEEARLVAAWFRAMSWKETP